MTNDGVITMRTRVSLRAKNQITIPEQIVRKLGLVPGDTLLVEADDRNPSVLHIRPVRRSYAGVAKGIYGDVREIDKYIHEERASWEHVDTIDR